MCKPCVKSFFFWLPENKLRRFNQDSRIGISIEIKAEQSKDCENSRFHAKILFKMENKLCA